MFDRLCSSLDLNHLHLIKIDSTIICGPKKLPSM